MTVLHRQENAPTWHLRCDRCERSTWHEDAAQEPQAPHICSDCDVERARRSTAMGMFDDVVVEYPLPDPALQDAAFQTKDLENTLATYTITADGRLLRGEHDVDYHGDLLIYTLVENDGTQTSSLPSYSVRFTHGRVEDIRRVQERWP